jgi:uncharacterized membrane protein
LATVTIAYPLVVYLSIGHLESQWLALMLLALALARASVARQRFWWAVAAGAALLCAACWFRSDVLAVKLYPVLVNLVLLAVFAFSVWRPPSVVERLARLREPDLPAAGVRYTRRVTCVWCSFFVFNGCLALYTALWGSDRLWALYNGLVAYVLMGILMATEWWVRQIVRNKQQQEQT